MAHYDQETFLKYEQRLEALESTWLTAEEQEVNRFIIRIVRSVRSTLWLINGGVKYFAAPIGFLWAIWAYGANAAEWFQHVLGVGGR